jgi:hypothetical protein
MREEHGVVSGFLGRRSAQREGGSGIGDSIVGSGPVVRRRSLARELSIPACVNWRYDAAR